MTIISTNPTNYEIIGEVDSSTEAEINNAVASARNAGLEWYGMGLDQRITNLQKLYKAFEDNKLEMAKLVTTEMGMPIKESQELDIDFGLQNFSTFLDQATSWLKPQISYQDNTMINEVLYEPFGVAAVIEPWNFPFAQFIWGVIPNLIVGNTVIFKHSEEVPLCEQLFEKIAASVNLPTGVLNFIYGDNKVGDYLIHQNIDLICFTGSTKTGLYLYQEAAEKGIKIVLEMGGSAPGIVFEDADLDDVIPAVLLNRFGAAGQICDGLKRLIVHESQINKVILGLSKALETKKIGNPSDINTDCGPLVAKRQLELLESQVNDSVSAGARILLGGKRPNHLTGAFYQPTLINNVKTTMRVWNEEVFGPVLPIVSFTSEAEAIELANDTQYGLGGYVFSQDREVAQRVASQLKTGMVAINSAYYLVPSSPFGGYKKSGLGRVGGHWGFHDVCQVKVIATPK